MAVSLINQAQLARVLRVSRQAVSKAVKTGRIVPTSGGLFDERTAVLQFRLHTDPEQQMRAQQQRPARASGVDQAPAPALVAIDRPMEFTGDAQALVAAKARREAAEADLAELELAEKRGTIMSVADHERFVFTLARSVRDALLQVPSRCAALVAAESEQTTCQRIVEAEIRAVLQQLMQIEAPEDADVVAG